MRDGRDRTMVLGRGSPFFDIVLPCGGGITLAVHVLRAAAPLKALLSALDGRQRAGLVYDPGNESIALAAYDSQPGWKKHGFVTAYRPRPQVLLCGGRIELSAASRVSLALGYDTVTFSDARALGSRPFHVDQDTAIAVLFHSLEKELELFDFAFSTDAFYIGALGSAKTHQRRIEALAGKGYSPQTLARLRAPIGLIPKTKDAASLAVSVLAEIAALYAACA
jgi:xanthine dehydrogenase accessory factor